MEINIEDLRLQKLCFDKITSKTNSEISLPKYSNKKFVKGPIPLAWLEQAARLPGSALAVGIMLWHLAGLTKGKTVKFALSRMKSFGVSEQAARRGLRSLREANLVLVNQKPGRSSGVTLLEAEL